MTCKDCSHLDWKDENDKGEFYCTYHGYYVDCRSCCNRNDDKGDGRDHSGGGCYLTTAMCTVLGKADDCHELEVLRGFRKNYMHKTDEGKRLLQEYDLISPPIAEKLLNSKNKTEIANYMLNNYISKSLDLIANGKNQEALETYKAMVLYIKDVLI